MSFDGLVQRKDLNGNLQAVPVAQIKGDTFVLRTSLTAATGASTSTSPAVTIGAQPFVWTHLGVHFNETNGDWSVKITDNGANYAFMSDKVYLLTLVGENKNIWELPFPYAFAGSSSIMVEATNGGSGTDTLYLSFVGKRVSG